MNIETFFIDGIFTLRWFSWMSRFDFLNSIYGDEVCDMDELSGVLYWYNI